MCRVDKRSGETSGSASVCVRRCRVNFEEILGVIVSHFKRRCAMLIVAMLMVLVPSAAFAAAHSAKKLTLLQQGLDYYRGKTVIMITPGPPGSNVDQTERIYAPLMSSLLNANIEVIDYPTGGAATGQDVLAHSTPNGLTFGNLNTGTDIGNVLTNTPGLTFNPIRLDFIGAYPSSQFVWVSNPSSQYSSFQSVIDAPTPVSMLDVISGAGNLYERTVNGIFDVKANVISAYASPNAMVPGFVRGDGPIAEHTAAVWQSMIMSGTARPILQSGRGRYTTGFANKLATVPTLTSLAQTDPPKTHAQREALSALLQLISIPQVYAVPAGTPKSDQVALAWAFKSVSVNRHVQTEELASGLPPGYIDGTTAKALWVTIGAKLKWIAPYINP